MDCISGTELWYPQEVEEHQRLLQHAKDGLSDWPDNREGRGIVICGGGERYLPGVWVLIHELRRLGFTYPIEVWHLGDRELSPAWRKCMEPLEGVNLMDALVVKETYPVRILNGWELKVYAILHCNFREVLLLDADNVPVRNPSVLFDDQEYQRLGAYFWPDLGRLGPERKIWSICGVPYQDEPEFETGQVLVDKKKCWRELNLTMHLNEYSDFYYRYIHGDKETFHMAWRIMETPYVMPQRLDEIHGTLCQYDREGELIFQHRNGHKWRLSGNIHVDGFINEEHCFAHLARLSPLLESEMGGLYLYERSGYDQRLIELLPGGGIGKGREDCEVSWEFRDSVLLLHGMKGCTAALVRNNEGIWEGHGLQFEKMPVRLIPHSQLA